MNSANFEFSTNIWESKPWQHWSCLNEILILVNYYSENSKENVAKNCDSEKVIMLL